MTLGAPALPPPERPAMSAPNAIPPPGATLWQRLRARRESPAGPDAADMGTAFGLDMSLGLPSPECAPVDPQDAAATPPRRPWWEFGPTR